MSEDIRQFQTKDERAGDELRWIIRARPQLHRFIYQPGRKPHLDPVIKVTSSDRMDNLEIGRTPCKKPNLPILPRVRLIPGSDPGYKTYRINP